MDIYSRIYKKLEALGVLDVTESVHLKSSGFMDLENGDLCPDPDMEIRVFPKEKMAEAMSYQDSFGYRVVYPEPGKVDIRGKKELNQFLDMWLSNLKNQGFRKF